MPPGLRRLVIVDDDPRVRVALQEMLAESGYQVVGIAETREQAVLVAAAALPDICLIDVRLAKGSSGVDAAAFIIHQLGIPVVMMSAAAAPILPLPFLAKPFGERALLAALGAAIEQSGRRGAAARVTA